RLVTDLLAGLLESEQRSGAAADRRIVQAGWELIDGYAAKGLRVQDLAARIGVGPEHLARVFRRYEDCTPQEAIASVRMQHAAARLVRERLPVKAVASEMGYATASHFSRAFKRVFGVTPAQFQRSGWEAWLP
ncbi:MAG: helix-turn-helix transcriptional regulator, partial [Planctomycetota bacterium]